MTFLSSAQSPNSMTLCLGISSDYFCESAFVESTNPSLQPQLTSSRLVLSLDVNQPGHNPSAPRAVKWAALDGFSR